MFAWELLQLLSQKAQGGDPQPLYFADALRIGRPESGGAVTSLFVGPAAAFGHQNNFIVPRTGLYLIYASVFARAGTVRVWQFNIDRGGQTFIQERIVSTSTGWRVGPLMLYLEEGTRVQIANEEATLLGDDSVASVWNFELAMSA
jgi:hypothetical protein